MAVYCKPSFNEYLTVFNPSNWLCGVNNDGTTTSGGISLAYANANFLKFPTAQGSETLINIDVLGTSQFNGSLNEFTNQTDFNSQTNFNNGIRLNTGTLRFPDATLQTTAYIPASSVASSVVVANGGSGAMYLALTQGTAGNYPILTNLPQYDATTTILSAPIINGTSNVISPLINTSPNGELRATSTTGQYSYFQQSSVGLGYDLNLFIPPAGGLLNILGGGVGSLPTANANAGLGVCWNSVPSSGISDFINYAQGGYGGFNFYSTNNTTNSTLIGTIPISQPAFNNASTTSIPSNNWVQGAIATATAGITSTISTTVINAVNAGTSLTLTPSGSSSFQNFKFNYSGGSFICGAFTCVGMSVNAQWTLSIHNGASGTVFISTVGSITNWSGTINLLPTENIYFKISIKSFNNVNTQYIEATYPLY